MITSTSKFYQQIGELAQERDRLRAELERLRNPIASISQLLGIHGSGLSASMIQECEAKVADLLSERDKARAELEAAQKQNAAMRAEKTDPVWGFSVCRGCGRPLYLRNVFVADGCPCNGFRGLNHGLVPTFVCTCKVCDPEETGSTRGNFVPRAVADALAQALNNTLVDDDQETQERGWLALLAYKKATTA